MFERYGIDDRNIYTICVVATMSSGKSTFINSIIGDEILPEKNEACTARTMAILDNDKAAIKRAHIIRKSGAKEIVEIDGREVLDRINNDEDIVDFLVETNIESIKNTDKAVMLVDTPGVNNSEDKKHEERTAEFLQQMEEGLIIYLMNATQFATTDDELLLKTVVDHVEQRNGSVKLIFILNKIDALDTETESIRGIVGEAEAYITAHGVKNPVIYPLSALSAKLLRMAYYRRPLTRREVRRLEDVFQNYRPNENNMLSYARINEDSLGTYQIGDEEISGQELLRAAANTGITAIENTIIRFMEEGSTQFSPEILIRATMAESVGEEYHARLRRLPAGRGDIDQEEVIKIKDMIKESSALSLLENQSIRSTNRWFKDDYSQTAFDGGDGELLADIENTKQVLLDAAENNSVLENPQIQGCFYIYEQNDEDKIRSGMLYMMSVDRLNWQKMNFVRASQEIKVGNPVFLRNVFTNFCYMVTENNLDSTTVILDMKLPVSMTVIGGMEKKGMISYSDISEYICGLENEEKRKREESEEVRARLERTYKGIVFNSVEEKENIIHKEQEFKEYCGFKVRQSYQQLQQTKERITNELPGILAAPLLTKILEEMGRREAIEKCELRDTINGTDIQGLEIIKKKLKELPYSQETLDELEEAVRKRALVCQRQILENSIREINVMRRKELKQLEDRIQKYQYDSALTEEFVGRIKRQYDIAEKEELKERCKDITEADIPHLELLLSQLEREGYQEKFLSEYREKIYKRIEYLHVLNMENAVQSLGTADKEKLRIIEKAIKEERCREELKDVYYNRIRQREEQLDYDELCRLTEGIENKSLEQLSDLYTTLQTKEYALKLKKPFLQRTRIYLEGAQYKRLDRLTLGMENKNHDDINAISKMIASEEYAPRIKKTAEDKLQSKTFELEMRQLIAQNNNFDSMGKQEIDRLEQLVRSKEISEKSRSIYLEKLRDRRYAIAVAEISRQAQFFCQLCNKYRIDLQTIKTPVHSPDYRAYADQLNNKYDRSGYDEIPIFIVPGKSEIAVTSGHFIYKAEDRGQSASIGSIFSFGISKKLLFDKLLINFKNGTTSEAQISLNKKSLAAFVQGLNEFLANMDNPAAIGMFPATLLHVENLNMGDYLYDRNKFYLNKEAVTQIFLQQYQQQESELGIKSYVCNKMNNKWSQSAAKVKQNFVIPDDELIWIYDRTILRSGKEGLAIGERRIYLKNGSENTVAVPIDKIYVIEPSEQKNGIEIQTTDNYIFVCEMAELRGRDKYRIAALLWEYVQGVQLMNYIGNEKPKIPGTSSVPSFSSRPKYCVYCGTPIKEGAKYCVNCGKKVEQII